MSFTPFCSSCCPTGPSAHASSGATVRRPAHAQTGEFPITRWLLILGGQPAEIDTAACLEAQTRPEVDELLVDEGEANPAVSCAGILE